MSAATVELSMIVKNGASSLARCLESVRDVVDRIVIGDTGSDDDGMAIARSFGAEVIEVPWERNFAKARNHVLRHSRCDWILVLDADEMLDNSARESVATAVAQKDIPAWDVWRWNYVTETSGRFGEEGIIANPYLLEASCPYPAYGRSLNTRFFRRHPEIYFERPVHENVSMRVAALGLRRAIAPFVIHHLGHAEDSSEVRGSKNELYQEIGKAYLHTRPEDARTCFELGLGELEHYKRPQIALEYFSQAIRLNPEDANALLFAGICLLRMRRDKEALELLHKSEKQHAGGIVLYEAIGDAYFHLGDYAQADKAYRRALSLGSASALIEAKLGAAEVHSGLKAQGLARVQQALFREPGFAELYGIASTTAYLAGRPDLASDIAIKRLALGKTKPFDFMLAATFSRVAGDSSRSIALLQEGFILFPDDPELREALQEHTCPVA